MKIAVMLSMANGPNSFVQHLIQSSSSFPNLNVLGSFVGITKLACFGPELMYYCLVLLKRNKRFNFRI